MATIITYGTFDTFHYGHYELLLRAKELGDRLIVGVSTDEFNFQKGKSSLFPFSRRYEWVNHLDFVDMVISENSWDQKEKDIERYSVDCLVMGDDWAGKFDFVPCRVVYLPRTPDVSSTQLKQLKG